MSTHAVLKKYFNRKKKSSTGFSVRSLALRLGVSASFLSRILSGKKPIPASLLPKLAKALDVEPELLVPTEKKRKKDLKTETKDWLLVDVDATKILRNWYYIPILELTTLKDFDGSLEQISKRLNISKTSVEIAVNELVSLNLLQLVDGKYKKIDAKIRITSSKSVPLIRKFHDDMLEQSQLVLRNATSEEDFQRRLITGITISANSEKVQKAKNRLAEFLYELANDLTADEGEDVYHLSAQLFPLTKK